MKSRIKFSAFAIVAVVAVAGSGCSPSPEKVCDHVMDIAKKELKDLGAKVTDEEIKKQKEKCVVDGEKQKSDNKTKWDCESKCAMGANTMKDLEECRKKCS